MMKFLQKRRKIHESEPESQDESESKNEYESDVDEEGDEEGCGCCKLNMKGKEMHLLEFTPLSIKKKLIFKFFFISFYLFNL